MFDQMTNVHLYEGCENRLLIVHMQKDFLTTDARLRSQLQTMGLEWNADSVLVLTGDPERSLIQGYHVTMDVFEPRGIDIQHPELAGSWSTMCGNGIRAVARYLIDTSNLACYIKTKSGIRKTDVLPHNQFRVCMGQFTTHKSHLQKYVRNFHLLKLMRGKIRNAEVFVGLNGNPGPDGAIDGEPHMVVFLRDYQNLTLNELQKLAEKLGPAITTNRKYFPECINTNFVVTKTRKHNVLSVLACTFERGVEYVTQACGTGATVIGSHLLSEDKGLREVEVYMPGGVLGVTRASDHQFYLTGPANPVNNDQIGY